MSNYILTAVWRYSRAQGAARLVLLSLADQANDSGWCRVSVENISKRCLISVRSVHRHLDTLVELGEVARKENAGRASEYQVLSENLCQSDTPVSLADLTSADLTEAPANLADPPLPTVSEGSATAGRQNHSLTTRANDKDTSSSPTAAAVDDDQDTTDPTPPAPKSDEPPRDDVERLCTHLAERLQGNDPDAKRPTITKDWRNQARLMLDRDGRAEDKIHAAIDWCQDDPFWMSNIRSMGKLREQYATLQQRAREQASRSRGPVARQQRNDQVFDAAMERARARDHANNAASSSLTAAHQPQGALTP